MDTRFVSYNTRDELLYQSQCCGEAGSRKLVHRENTERDRDTVQCCSLNQGISSYSNKPLNFSGSPQ